MPEQQMHTRRKQQCVSKVSGLHQCHLKPSCSEIKCTAIPMSMPGSVNVRSTARRQGSDVVHRWVMVVAVQDRR